jgi:hypothetical protein
MTRESTYNATCLCGQPVASHERETRCASCGRLLVFEWGAEPSVVVGNQEPAEKAKGAGQ